MKLTKNGRNALAKCLLGKELKFCEVRIGSGFLDENESIYELEDLKTYQMTLPLTAMQVKGDGTFELTAYLSNAELSRGFLCTEHSIWAYEPDSGEKIMYAYRNLNNEGDFIPSFSGSAVKNIFLSYICEIQDATNIQAVIDYSVAYVSVPDFKEHLNDPHPHKNAPCHYDDVATTSEIWCTDSDNHLHLIGVENLREVLKTPEVEKKSDADIIAAAQNEIGLSANLLVIEDFSDNGVTDKFKVKVNSAAENGNLLGVEDFRDLKIGAVYILSDGVNFEEVLISSVTKNIGGYHCKLKNPLANSYVLKNLYLYRSTAAPCQKFTKNWKGETFSGIAANVPQVLEMDTSYLTIAGDAVIDAENYLTLA